MQAEATIQQAVDLVTTTEPTVTYDAKNQTISATVIVSLPSGASNLVFASPIIAVPGTGGLGTTSWTVLWNLVIGEGLSSVSFPSSDGIVVPTPGTSLPPNVQNQGSQIGPVPTQWQVTLKNMVTDVNSLSYDITAEGIPSAEPSRSYKTTTSDPTIVVTKDPIG